MTTITKNKFFGILIILIIAFLLRVYNFSFPAFTSDEARIAYRGYTLATSGRDELGRAFPLLFDSLKDYQLPLVSYLTAGGELVFGKSEFGARIPFIILGTALVLLVYQLAKFFNQTAYFRLTSAFIVAFSPSLIFLSRVPNEIIVLTFLFTLLFYFLISKKNIAIITLTMTFSVLASKQAWFILFPFMFFMLFSYLKSLDQKKRFMLFGLAAALVFSTFTLFLAVPQAKRSLLENNFSLFSDITIKNGIDKLRGQGIESGWPQSIDRLLFNKGHFFTAGLLHWLSNLSPAIYFGQLDSSGEISYSYLGTWAKILLVPFIFGIFFLLRTGNKNNRLIFPLLLILTFPSFFVYPNFNLEIVVLTLPFIALIISFGFEQMNRKIGFLILFLMIMELFVNIFNLTPEYKNTDVLRPVWIEKLTNNIFEKSKERKTAVSDDIVSDIAPFIEWHTPFNPQAGFLQVDSPYKFRQYQLSKIKIIGSDENFTTCSKDEKIEVFASDRDLDKIRRQLQFKIVDTYKDSNKENKVYLIEGACI